MIDKNRFEKPCGVLKCAKIGGDSTIFKSKDAVTIYSWTGMRQIVVVSSDQSGSKLSTTAQIHPIEVVTLPGKHMTSMFKAVTNQENVGDIDIEIIGNISPAKSGTIGPSMQQKVTLKKSFITVFEIEFDSDEYLNPMIIITEFDSPTIVYTAQPIKEGNVKEGNITYVTSSAALAGNLK